MQTPGTREHALEIGWREFLRRANIKPGEPDHHQSRMAFYVGFDAGVRHAEQRTDDEPQSAPVD